MSDDPKPGWYVIIDPDGRHTCRWRENSIVYATGRKAIAIDDLLRDAARWQTINRAGVTNEQRRMLMAAETARESGE